MKKTLEKPRKCKITPITPYALAEIALVNIDKRLIKFKCKKCKHIFETDEWRYSFANGKNIFITTTCPNCKNTIYGQNVKKMGVVIY